MRAKSTTSAIDRLHPSPPPGITRKAAGDLRYQFTSDHFLNDAHITYQDASYSPHPVTDAPGYRLTTANKDEVVLITGGGDDFSDKGQKGWGIQDDFTFFWLDHTIKTGVKYQQIEISSFEQQPYNPQFSYDVNADLTIPFHVRFGAPLPGLPDQSVTSRNKQFGIYVQDDWDVSERLQLNLGVRWDYEETPSYLDYVTPGDVIAGINSLDTRPGAPANQTYRQTLALGAIDIDDYISTGNNRDAFKDAIAPRLGFSYDLTADERLVLFGGAGRSYDRNVFDYLALEVSKGTFPAYERTFNAPAHPCTPGVGDCVAWDPAYYDRANLQALVAANPNLGREINLINNELKTPYSDQFSLGLRSNISLGSQDWVTSVTASYVESKDGIVFLLGNRYPDGSFRPPGTTWGNQPWGNGIPGLGSLIVAKNGIETRTTSLLLYAEKPITQSSPWGVTLAYTYTDAEENRSNAAFNDEHYVFDFPEVSGFGWHPSTGVSKHRLVATGIADVPWGFTLSAKLTLATPRYFDATNCNDAPNFDNCFVDPFEPDTTFGQRLFDVAVAKNFNVWSDFNMSVRADVLNLFDYDNASGYEGWRGGPGEPQNPAFATANAYAQPTRTFKLSFSANWR